MREGYDIGAYVVVGIGGGARLSREGCEGQQPGVALDAFSQRCRWASADGEDGTDSRARVHPIARLPTDGTSRRRIMLDFAFENIYKEFRTYVTLTTDLIFHIIFF